jgi:hypothetical protein
MADLKPHGTPAGILRHQRRGEPLCDDCLEGQHRRQAGVSRYEPRNGLPEFRPYRWRGVPGWDPARVSLLAADPSPGAAARERDEP